MELQQLRYVVALAEERSFTRAAARCFVVQSSLSHQLRALEDELGVTLFARSSRRVEPTPAGAAFVEHARACLASAERAVVDAAAATGAVRGTLTIGLIPTVTAIDIPAALESFHRAHPAVTLRLRGGGSDDFLSEIRAGRMDIAVLGLPEGAPLAGVSSRVLARERLVAVLPADHRLAGRRRIRLVELADEPFVDFPAGRPGRIPSDLAFAAAGVRREVAFEVMGPELMLDLVGRGLGVAMLAPAVVPRDRAGLRTIPVVAGPVRIEALAWSDFNPSPAATAFLDELGAASAPASIHHQV